jgi:hypothetical protein
MFSLIGENIEFDGRLVAVLNPRLPLGLRDALVAALDVERAWDEGFDEGYEQGLRAGRRDAEENTTGAKK